jgi:putative SOS response-associated peptidase YedK
LAGCQNEDICGRFVLKRINLRRYGLAEMPEAVFLEFADLKIVPRFNIAPSQRVLIIRTGGGRP